MPWSLPDALETSAVAACAFAIAKAFAEGDARGRTPARSAGGGPPGPHGTKARGPSPGFVYESRTRDTSGARNVARARRAARVNRGKGRTTAFALGAVWALASRAAAAQEGPQPDALPVAFGADEVSVDAQRRIEARGNVHVDAPPFHMQGTILSLRRVATGVELDGAGRVAFCPCLGTPLAVRFRSATLAPPHDLVLRDPVLEIFGVPVAWAPLFWLRSPGRVGLLAPDVAWRGDDGFFAGGGVHVPWQSGDLGRGVDLRAGGYAQGGVAVEGTLRTAASTTTVRLDELRSDVGVMARARGATGLGGVGEGIEAAVWDLDALRGTRAVRATTDVEAAARPFDRLQAAASWAMDGWVFSSGVRAAALRGGDLSDLGAVGPVAVVRRSDAIGHVGAFDATLEGGQVAVEGQASTSFARAEGGALLGAPVGPLGASLALRGIGSVADDGGRSGANGAVQARGVLSSPLARGFDSSEPQEPWVHTTEPRVEVAALATRADDVLPTGRGMTAPAGGAWVAAAGWDNAVGRWGSRAAGDLDVSAGVIAQAERVVPLLRARVAAGAPWVALQSDFARVQGESAAGRGLHRARTAGPESWHAPVGTRRGARWCRPRPGAHSRRCAARAGQRLSPRLRVDRRRRRRGAPRPPDLDARGSRRGRERA